MNETEFETFYDEHARPLWAYIRRLSDRAEIADDIVQESFMRFLSAQPKSNANEKAYLYRIATNLTYDYFRSSKRDAKRQADFALNVDSEPAYEPFAANSGLSQVFRQMKMQERALLWLAYVEGHEHAEIAGMLGLKSLSVRVLLFRARRKLVNLLEAGESEASKL